MRSAFALALLASCSFSTTIGGDASIEAGRDSATDGAPLSVRRINIGGAAHTGIDFPGQWEADAVGASICGPAFWPVTGGILGTQDDALFTNHIYGLPTVTCAIAGLAAGTYEVTLLFGPTFYGAGCNSTAQQRFSIVLEGTIVATDFNLSVESLGCVKDTSATPAAHPVAKVFSIPVSDGTLNLSETAPSGQAAMLSAIQLVRTQ